MTSDRDEMATQPLQAEKSLGELFKDLAGELGDLFRSEVELAKTEARDEAGRAARAGAFGAAAGLGAVLALMLLSLALAWLLDQAMNRALAFAIVGVVWAIVAAVLAKQARSQIKGIRPIPETIDTIKEDAAWAATRKS